MAKKNIFKAKKAKVAMEELPEDQGANGEDRSAGTPESNAQAPKPPLPLFYKSPQPLHNVRHAGKGLKKAVDFGFASTAHAVAIHIQEFRLAASSYPIVFADDDSPMPLAILGIRDGENLFIDEKGQWAPGTYVPAYVRRYPFATGQGVKEGEQILYVDEASDLIVDCDGEHAAEPLFAEDVPSERTKEIREFCGAFQQQAPVTTAFVEEVKKRDLLGSKEIRLDLPDDGNQLLTGLRIIDEEKFNALSDDVFLEWRHNGWLPLVYWHWASMDNFLRLLHRR